MIQLLKFKHCRTVLLMSKIAFLQIPCYWASAETEKSSSLINQVFKTEQLSVLIYILLFLLIFLVLFRRARRGEKLFLRRIAGLSAIDEAIGRATEMGKNVLYVPGIDDIDEIQTLASLNILPYVAEKCAQSEIQIIVPTRTSVVLSVAEEIVKEAYLKVGRPEMFNRNNIRYLSDEQFAFTAAVGGIMHRERPAANFYLGSFYAESLILAETGFVSSAIQIAGSASIAQLPFFVAACDYTIIGEEFYAASAYLSSEPSLLAGIKAADFLKVCIIIVLGLGIGFATLMPKFLQYLKFIF